MSDIGSSKVVSSVLRLNQYDFFVTGSNPAVQGRSKYVAR